MTDHPTVKFKSIKIVFIFRLSIISDIRWFTATSQIRYIKINGSLVALSWHYVRPYVS